MTIDAKTGAVAAAAVVALGVASWIGFRSFGGGRQVRSADRAAEAERVGGEGPGGQNGGEAGPRRVELNGPAAEWIDRDRERAASYSGEFDFPKKDRALEAFDDPPWARSGSPGGAG